MSRARSRRPGMSIEPSDFHETDLSRGILCPCGRIPCPTHELPCGREKIPCPGGVENLGACVQRAGLRRALASGKLEPAVSLEKLPAKFPTIGNSSRINPTECECRKRPATAPAPRSRASRRHRSPTRPAPTTRRSRIRSGRSAAWSACRSPCRCGFCSASIRCKSKL